MERQHFTALLEIMDRLLGENGCPWDQAQTHESLKPYLLEESYEAVDAIERGDMDGLCEELGDLLMEVVFQAKLAERASRFTIDDVLDGICQKLIRRHSHIFGEDRAANAAEVEAFWEMNKNKEKQYASTAEKMRAVPKAMPALMRAEKVIKRAKPEAADAQDSFLQAQALLSTLAQNAQANAPAGDPPVDNTFGIDFGKLLFLLAKIAAILGVNAEISLTNQIEAFINSN